LRQIVVCSFGYDLRPLYCCACFSLGSPMPSVSLGAYPLSSPQAVSPCEHLGSHRGRRCVARRSYRKSSNGNPICGQSAHHKLRRDRGGADQAAASTGAATPGLACMRVSPPSLASIKCIKRISNAPQLSYPGPLTAYIWSDAMWEPGSELCSRR